MIPQQPPSPANPGSNQLAIMLSVLAGGGFDRFASGVKKLADAGIDFQTLAQVPNLQLILAGAGMKDAANSMEIVGPMLKQFAPPPPSPESQINPQHAAAAMQMMQAKLGPGMAGIQPPIGPGPMMGGPGPMMGPGGPMMMPPPKMGGLR